MSRIYIVANFVNYYSVGINVLSSSYYYYNLTMSLQSHVYKTPTRSGSALIVITFLPNQIGKLIILVNDAQHVARYTLTSKNDSAES